MARQLFYIVLVAVIIQCTMMSVIPRGNVPPFLDNLPIVNETTTSEATTTTVVSFGWRNANESESVGHHNKQKREAEDDYQAEPITTEYQQPPTTTTAYNKPPTTTTGYYQPPTTTSAYVQTYPPYDYYPTQQPYYTTTPPVPCLKNCKGKINFKEIVRAVQTVAAYIAGVLFAPFVFASKILPPPPPPIPVTQYY